MIDLKKLKIKTKITMINERMIKMSEAKEVKVADKIYIDFNQPEDTKKAAKKPRRNRSSRNQTEETATLGPCPRSADEVYSFGVSLQYYIGDIYLELEALTQGEQRLYYKNLALSQLNVKQEIEKLANENLNRLLWYFYNNGGPIIEAPVTDNMAKEIQPFFNRIAVNFMNQLDVLVRLASKGNMSPSEMESTINEGIIDMYTTMGMLFNTDEIQDSFNELIEIIRSL